MKTEKIDNGIYILKVPFEDLTTTVYFYKCEQEVAVIDSATFSSDVDDYIIPALNEIGVKREEVKYLLLTHDHGDHMGGLKRLSEIFTDAVIGVSFGLDLPNRTDLIDGNTVLGSLMSVCLPGHTNHSFGFYDLKTKTLLSGDCLQLSGVGKYRDGIWNKDLYIASINKLKNMEIERIVASHEYEPLGSIAEGKTQVIRYLDECIALAKSNH